MNIGLLLLRIIFGLTLAAHGVQKLFSWLGGAGIAGTASLMERVGLRPPRAQAVLAGVVESSAGLALAAGFVTPLAAAAFISIMLVAIVTVHLRKGFFMQDGGYEHPLALATGALALAFTGPGRLSVDAALGIEWRGDAWGVIALTVALIGGSGVLLSRHRPAAEHQSAGQAA